MKNISKTIVCIIAVMLYTGRAKAQTALNGTYNVPGNYPTIGAAINELNIYGVTGPVIINVAAGHTETASPGGYSLVSVIGSGSVNTITFQKSGGGPNPIITAFTGTASPSSQIQDGVWSFIGSDFVTVDGIDIVDPNTTSPASMEYGYGFFRANANNGCQNNTIKNCTITLSNLNNGFGSGPAVDGSRGINVVASTYTLQFSTLTINSAAGSNSNNKFYSNLINRCNIGIALIGFQSASPFTTSDFGNDVGGLSAATGNTIVNFGGGGTTSPAAGIRTLAQYNLNISNNLLNNNNGTGINHQTTLRGIYVNSATSANATINNNTLSVVGGTATAQVSVIENVSGTTAANNTITISNNLLMACGTTTATSGSFYGIWNQGSCSHLRMNGNSFVSNTRIATSGLTYLLYNSGAVVSTQEMMNNNLGGISISHPTVAYSGTHYGIYNLSGTTTNSVNISNNSFSSYTSSPTFSSTGTWRFIYNINGVSSLIINNNTFNNINLNHGGGLDLISNQGGIRDFQSVSSNSVVGSVNKGVANGTFSGYNGSSSPLPISVHNISNNNFSNMTATVSGSGSFIGIISSEVGTSPFALKTFSNNVISNIDFRGTGTSNGININGLGDGGTTSGSSVYNNAVNNVSVTGGSFYGLWIQTSTSPNYKARVYDNIISNISAGGTQAYGAIFSSNTINGADFYRNKVYNITGTGPASNAMGIYLNGGVNLSLYNNLIGSINTPTGSIIPPNPGIYGIAALASGAYNIFYNSVLLNGSVTGVISSCALFGASTATFNLNNNIFVNNTNTNGTAKAYAFFRNGTTALSSLSLTSNNNLFYAGVPSASNIIYAEFTTDYQTLANYKTYASGREANSVTENPTFASTAGATTNFLNLNTAVPTQVESGGVSLSSVSTDFGLASRAGFPDIGAWEGTYTPSGSDLFAPSLLGSGFISSACNNAGRTFTASLSDVTGVGSGTASPRVYYRINAGGYTSVAGSLSSGSATLGVWTFSLTYTAAANDIISYYIVAQDGATTPNLMASPSAGFIGSNVSSITADPTSPNTYTNLTALAGTYTVGASGTFTSLGAAANAYNTSCLTGPVTFVLTDATYTNEVFPVTFLNNPDANATNSLLIIPAPSLTVAITNTNTAAVGVIKMLNARYITIDGLNASGSALNINNNSTGASAGVWISSGSLIGAKYITVKNTNFTGGTISNTFHFGIVACADGANPSTTTGADNDFVTITGNTFQNMYHAIGGFGTSANSAGGLDNWLISANRVGPITNGATNLRGNGIFMQGAVNLSITANVVQNFSVTSTNLTAIRLNSNITGYVISQNTVTSHYSSASSSGASSNAGIYLGTAALNGTVSYNQIYRIENTSTGGWGARGIIITTGNANTNLKVFNNSISDIVTYSDASIVFAPVGIEILGSSGGVDLDYNSVYLFGQHPGLTSSCFSSPLSVTSVNTNIRIRNNHFINTYENTSSTTDIAYGIYSSVANTNYTAMDNNNYYVGGNAVLYPGYQLGNFTTLSALVTALGQNANSKSLPVAFTATNDLHLVPSSQVNALIDNAGAPVAGITLDIDNTTRSSTTPDIGVDEFTSTATCTSAIGGTLSATSLTICSTSLVSLSANNVSSGSGSAYQWMAAPTAGGSYTNLAASSASTTAFSSSLSPGIYYMVHRSTCSSSTAVSNEATVTVISPATTSISASTSVVCVSNSFTLMASGATNYTWSTGVTGTNAIVITPSSSANYFVTGSNGLPCLDVTSGNVGVYFSQNPTVSVVSNTTQVCAGLPATLTASGAFNYNWSPSGSGASIVVMPSTTTNYSVVGSYSNGCSTPTVFTGLTVNPNPTLNTSGSTGICTGQNASVTAAGAVTYSWSTGSTSNSIVTAPPVGTTVYTVTGTDALGCLSKLEHTVSVAASLSISIVGPGAICIGQTANLTGNGGVTYTWNTGATSQTIAPSPTITTTYSIIGASGTCSNTGMMTLTVNPNPTVSITGNNTICVNQTTTLNANGAISYTWNTNSNTTSIPVSPTVNTTYTLTGENVFGCRNSNTISVTTNSLPIITIAQSASTVCVNSVAGFTASGASTYSWSTGSNNTSINITPSVAATYSISGTNPAGCLSGTTFALATYSLPILSILPSSATVCSMSQASFNVSGATTYTWDNSATTSTIAVSPTVSTVYSVTGTSSDGCVSNATVGVTTNSLPIVTIAPPSITVCAFSPASFTAAGAVTYTWNNTIVSPTVTLFQGNNTTYSVSGVSPDGCLSSATVAVFTNPLPTITAMPQVTTVCELSTLTLSASGANTYSWSNGSTITTAVVTPTGTASYTVLGTDANGCSSVGQAVVITNPLPVLNISPANATVCSASSVTLTATGANTYSWSSGSTGAGAVVSPTVNTAYTVVGTETLTGCSSSKSVTVITRSLPIINATSSSTAVCDGSSATLTASGANTYTWNNSATTSTLGITPVSTTSYSVSGTDSFGCMSSGTVQVVVNPLPMVVATPSTQFICVDEVATFSASGASNYTWFPSNVSSPVFTISSPVQAVMFFTVVGTDANSCSNLMTLVLNVKGCVGIGENQINSHLVSVFPNPSAGQITAKFEFEGKKQILITDGIGRVIEMRMSENLNEEFDLSRYAKGVYYVKITSKTASANFKVSVQ